MHAKLTVRTVADATGGSVLRGRHDRELTGISTDTRTLRPGELFFALCGAQFDAHDFLPQVAAAQAGAAVVHRKDAANCAPGLPLVIVKDTTRALGDLAHWHREQCSTTTVIAITGSNGKTTTKEILFHILDGVVRSVKSIRSFNNAFGVPLTLFQVRPADAFTVLEMGTNSPGEIARLCEIANPDVGLVTNITATHLEGLGTIEGVAREKSVLLKHTARRGGAFYNADDYWSRQFARKIKGSLSSFGLENDADLRGFNLRTDQTGISFKILAGPRIHVPVAGAHNAANALAAVAVARKLGVDWNRIIERLATFRLPPFRMETRTTAGVTLINDAYNANPVSMEAAAKTLAHLICAGRKILVVADMFELGDQAVNWHRKLGTAIAGFRFDYLLGLGEQTAYLLGAAAEHGMKKEDLLLAASKDELAAALLRLVQPGDTVLFKGSRAMSLESVVALVRDGLGTEAGAPSDVPVYELYRSADEIAAEGGDAVPSPAAHSVG